MLRKALPAVLALFLISMTAASVASVSDIQYDDGEEEFRIFFISSQTTEEIDTIMPFHELSDSVDEGSVDQDVTISVDEQSQEARYPTSILHHRQELMPMTYHNEEGFSSHGEAKSWAETHCYAGDDGQVETSVWKEEYFTWSTDITNYQVYCLTPDEGNQHNLASLQSPPDEVFETHWTVKAEGEVAESGTISNADVGAGQSVSLGPNVQITWQGNLDTGTNPPNPTSEIAAYNNAEGWILIDENEYEAWKHYVNQESVDRLEAWMNGKIDEESLQNEVDEYYNDASTPYTQSPLSDTEVDGGFEDAVFVKEMEQDSIWPSFVLDIDGDYIEVSESVGEPNIIDITETQVQEGDRERVQISVRNEGDGDGSFVTRITECDENFRSSGTSDRVLVEPGSVETFTQYVSFSAGYDSEATIEGSCTVEAEDITSNEIVSTEFTVEGQQTMDCPAGELDVRVDEDGNDVIFQWSDDCQVQQDIQTCTETDEGEELFAAPTTDGYECQLEDEPETTDACAVTAFGFELYEDPVCAYTNNITGGFSEGFTTGTAIQTFLMLVVAIVGFGIGNRKLPEFAGIEDGHTRALIGVVFAALTAVIFYGIWNNVLAWIAAAILVVLYLKFGWIAGAILKLFR